MRERHDLETQRNFRRDLTGSLDRISKMISSGKQRIVSDAEVWILRVILVFLG